MSSQTLRRAEAQELEDRGSEIPVARNNLKIASWNERKYEEVMPTEV